MSEFEKNNLPQEDEYIIGKGFSINEEILPEEDALQKQEDTNPNTEAKKPKKQKNKKEKKPKSRLRAVIWVISIFVVSIALAVSIIYVGADYLGIAFGRGGEKVITVPQGSSATQISEILEESGAVKVPLAFRLYAKIKGYDNQFKYGVYKINTEAGYDDIAQQLITQGAKATTVKVTIPEGVGINDYNKYPGKEKNNYKKVVISGIATILEKNGVCTKEDFITALKEYELEGKLLSNCDPDRTYYALEGYLFPDTYEFFNYDSKECAKLAVEKMIKRSEEMITEDMYKKAEEMGYSMNQILTMASIIQMEGGNDTENLPRIAAVFYNRLNSKNFNTLGSTPTMYYGESFKRDDDRYDTYKANGLPPGPLCSPGIEAIKAALNPDSSPYYYFVTDSDGKFYFHETEDEQDTTINELKEDGKWIYEPIR